MPLDFLFGRDEIFLYLSNTNVRIGNARISVTAAENDKDLWIVEHELEITEKEGRQTIKTISKVDKQLRTHSYEEKLSIENDIIYSTSVSLDIESGIYSVSESRDGVEFSQESFKSQHSYPILFSGKYSIISLSIYIEFKRLCLIDQV